MALAQKKEYRRVASVSPRVRLARIEKSISECWSVFENRLQIDPINRSRLVNIQFDSTRSRAGCARR